MGVEVGRHGGGETISTLLTRLQPGDEVLVTTNRMWNEENNGPRRMRIRTVTIEEPPGYDEEYYRVYGEGPRQRGDSDSGSYVLMPDKPEGKGSNPVPEVFHRTPDPDADYRETTKGSITDLRLVARR